MNHKYTADLIIVLKGSAIMSSSPKSTDQVAMSKLSSTSKKKLQ